MRRLGKKHGQRRPKAVYLTMSPDCPSIDRWIAALRTLMEGIFYELSFKWLLIHLRWWLRLARRRCWWNIMIVSYSDWLPTIMGYCVWTKYMDSGGVQWSRRLGDWTWCAWWFWRTKQTDWATSALPVVLRRWFEMGHENTLMAEEYFEAI